MPINKLIKKVDNLEKEIEEKVDTLVEEKDEMKKEIEMLQENIGTIDIYKAIIQSNKRSERTSIITIVILSILLLIMIFTTIHNEKEFAKYRENSIDKTELFEILDKNI